MGDLAAEEENENLRGILVAPNFDVQAKAAARVVPSFILRKYSARCLFWDGTLIRADWHSRPLPS
jgi:hypothetical protein